MSRVNDGGAATHRAPELEFADGSTVAVEDVQCRGTTNSDLGVRGTTGTPDTNGNQFMCNVYQEPMYLFFAEENGRQQVSRLRRRDEKGAWTKKNYRFAHLQRQYAKLTYVINLEVVQKIDNLFGPTACSDAQGNSQNSGGVVVLNRDENFGPEPELQQA
jgi:hypothetical protein